MNPESSEKKGFKDFLKSNIKLLIGSSIVLISIGILLVWFDYKDKKKRIEVSENFIEAKIRF